MLKYHPDILPYLHNVCFRISNILIANPPRRFGLIHAAAQRRIAEEALARAGAEDIHPRAMVRDLPLSRRQMVEIAKALVGRPRILILDEATSALTASDVTLVAEYPEWVRQHPGGTFTDICILDESGGNPLSTRAELAEGEGVPVLVDGQQAVGPIGGLLLHQCPEVDGHRYRRLLHGRNLSGMLRRDSGPAWRRVANRGSGAA